MIFRIIGLLFLIFSTQSCTTLKDIKLFQKNENTVLNEYGLIEHGYEPYRLQVDDRVTVVIETNDPNAKEFFSPRNLRGNVSQSSSGNQNQQTGSLRIESDGQIHLLGLGSIYLLGMTQEQATLEVQKLLDEVYIENMAIARLYVESLKFTVLGEVNSPGPKTADDATVNLFEAIALCGDLTNYADRRNVHIWRQYPEGIKRVDIDLTREDVINSPYFYLHPNDFIQVDPIPEKIIGIGGRTAWQDITQLISVLTVTISTYFLIKNL